MLRFSEFVLEHMLAWVGSLSGFPQGRFHPRLQALPAGCEGWRVGLFTDVAAHRKLLITKCQPLNRNCSVLEAFNRIWEDFQLTQAMTEHDTTDLFLF